MRKLLTAALLATTMFGSVAPALATGLNEFQQHNNLISALVSHGIRVYLDGETCKPGLSGFYHSSTKSLVLCNGGSTQMTDENMDTLRHEAVHAMQDCRDGIKGNQRLDRVLKPGTVEGLASDTGLSLERIREIYLSHGVDEYTITLEYEAFTAAAAMDAGTIATALNTFCGAAN
jgi:hypothetical protein